MTAPLGALTGGRTGHPRQHGRRAAGAACAATSAVSEKFPRHRRHSLKRGHPADTAKRTRRKQKRSPAHLGQAVESQPGHGRARGVHARELPTGVAPPQPATLEAMKGGTETHRAKIDLPNPFRIRCRTFWMRSRSWSASCLVARRSIQTELRARDLESTTYGCFTSTASGYCQPNTSLDRHLRPVGSLQALDRFRLLLQLRRRVDHRRLRVRVPVQILDVRHVRSRPPKPRREGVASVDIQNRPLVLIQELT